MPNPENVKPYTIRSTKEARKRGRNGGIASGAARRRKSTIQSIMKSWADKPVTSEQMKREAENYGIDTDEGRALIAFWILQNAMNGNSKYMEMVLKMLGEDEANHEEPDDGFAEAIRGTAAIDWADYGKGDT